MIKKYNEKEQYGLTFNNDPEDLYAQDRTIPTLTATMFSARLTLVNNEKRIDVYQRYVLSATSL